MTEPLYVATDRSGIEHVGEDHLQWNLPRFEKAEWHRGEETKATTHRLTLRNAYGLTDALDESIFVAEAIAPSTTALVDGTFTVDRAVLVAGANWNVMAQARFALDCAAHVTNNETSLPDGTILEAVLRDARAVLTSAGEESEHRLSRLARLGVARRLRRKNEQVTDLARELLTEDVERDLDAISDPQYATTAAVADAVLAAVEAIRHIALPRYFEAREDAPDTHPDGDPAPMPTLITTPWGPIAIGAEHRSAFAPSWMAARDAANRARDAARDRGGESAQNNERAFQAQLLAGLLGER